MSTLNDMDEHVDKEMKAFLAIADLLERAKGAKRLFEEAGLPIPPSLSRILGDTTERADLSPKMVVSRPTTPQRPPEAKDDWIWLDASDAIPTSLVLAILRKQSGTMKIKDIFSELSKYQPEANFGSMLNIGPRLDQRKLIERSDDGWRLLDSASAPVLFEGNVWGPRAVFMQNDLAGHRRAMICHILQAAQGGLQIVQLVTLLQNSGLCRAPVNKDLLKYDMETLEKSGKARRISNSRKWTVARQKKASE